MIRTNFGYIHENGDVEGFSALCFSQGNSDAACLRLVQKRCEELGHPYNADRLIKTKYKSLKMLTSIQRKKIRADWKLVRNPGDPDPSSGKVGFFG